MRTCEIDATALENACFNLEGIADILINLAEVAEDGATEISHNTLYFLASQVKEQKRQVETATASAYAPLNVTKMPRQSAAN